LLCAGIPVLITNREDGGSQQKRPLAQQFIAILTLKKVAEGH